MSFFTDAITSAVASTVGDQVVKAVSSIVNGGSNSSSTTPAATSSTDSSAASTTTTSTTSGTFEDTLRALLSPHGATEVSEEELFASVVSERVGTLKDDSTAKAYQDLLKTEEDKMKVGGYIPFEAAAKAALKDLRDTGALTKDEADKIYSEAFAASQLDSNADALWDNIGGGSDPTKAVGTMTDAIAKAKATVEGFDTGKSTFQTRSLDEAAAGSPSSVSSGSAQAAVPANAASLAALAPLSGGLEPGWDTPIGGNIDGKGGFLFKPVSAHRTLVVLMGDHSSAVQVSLKDSSGKVIETSHLNGHLGTRPIFRFKKPGGAYPQNLTVEVKMANGTVKNYNIPDPSKRWD